MCVCLCARTKLLQSYLTLYNPPSLVAQLVENLPAMRATWLWSLGCKAMDCSPPGSSVHGIPQARILKCVALPFSMDLPNARIKPVSFLSPALAGGSLPLVLPEKPHWSNILQRKIKVKKKHKKHTLKSEEQSFLKLVKKQWCISFEEKSCHRRSARRRNTL